MGRYNRQDLSISEFGLAKTGKSIEKRIPYALYQTISPFLSSFIIMEALTQWVKTKHAGQVKKYTGEPYFNHLIAVADIAEPITMLGYEIGLCHDLLEDTATTENQLVEALLSFGYNDMEANYITVRVVELTDVFTAAAYPGLSRTERKEREAERLLTISAGAQTVKYADLIDNMIRVTAHDPENAVQYLEKKIKLLDGLLNGNADLRQQALAVARSGLETLKSDS